MSLRVIIYALPGCVQCRRARAFLLQQRIPFREVNVLTHPRVLDTHCSGSTRMLPLIAVGRWLIKGWDRRQLRAALQRHVKEARKQTPVHGEPPVPPGPARGP